MEKVVETGCYLVHFLLLPECGHHQFVDYSATFWMRMPKKTPNFIYIEFEFWITYSWEFKFKWLHFLSGISKLIFKNANCSLDFYATAKQVCRCRRPLVDEMVSVR
jgi:hypothetical protein